MHFAWQDRERALLGEDPADPSGYFIVEGHEYSILLQEQLVVNKILVMELEADNPTAKFTVDTVIGTMFTDLTYDTKTKVFKFLLPIQRNTSGLRESHQRAPPLSIIWLQRASFRHGHDWTVHP